MESDHPLLPPWTTSSGVCLQGALGIRNNTTLPFCGCLRRACVRLSQLSRKISLGSRKGHRPGSPSGKWNPESGSQTSNHTFVLFIHFPSAELPERPEGGEQMQVQVCVLGNGRGRHVGTLQGMFSPCSASRSDGASLFPPKPLIRF